MNKTKGSQTKKNTSKTSTKLDVKKSTTSKTTSSKKTTIQESVNQPEKKVKTTSKNETIVEPVVTPKKEAVKEKKREKCFSKFWVTLILETLYIFIVEMILKVLLDSFIWDYSILRIFLSSVAISVILTTLLNNTPNKVRKGILIFINFFIALYAWLQLGFTNYVGGFMSIGNASQGTKILSYIGDFVASYQLSSYILYVPFILSIVYNIFEHKLLKDGYNYKIDFKDHLNILIGVISFVLVCTLYYATLKVGFMQNKYQTVKNTQLFKYASSPALAIKNFGTTVYLGLDIKGSIFGGEEVTYTVDKDNTKSKSTTRIIDDSAWNDLIEKEHNSILNTLNNYYINRTITDKNEYTGKFKDKNLIMIMMESVSEPVFLEQYKEYFPTLYKMYSEGMTVENNYSPRNNCSTGESEMTSQISLYTIGTTCTVNTYKNNEYRQSLFYKLRDSGYYTSAYHDYTDQYYSRSTYEYNLGHYRYYGVESLGVSWQYEYKEWPSDLEFMEKAIPKFIDQRRFATEMVSVSAHTPYNSSSKVGNKHLDLFKDTDYSISLKRYLSKVKELDLALELLLNTLEEKGILDDTVIVLFGDHYPYGLSDKDYQKLTTVDIKENSEVERTPFIIYNSATAGEKIDKVTTPLDYTPTLLNLFGVNYDPRQYMGNDIFSDYTDFAVFPDNSWQSSKGYYSASKGQFIPKEGAEETSDEEIIKINQDISEMRMMSSLTISKNYFKYLYNYFDEYNLAKQKEQANNSESNSQSE